MSTNLGGAAPLKDEERKEREEWAKISAPLNPIAKAQDCGEDVPGETYIEQGVKRGDPEYVMSRSDLKEFSRCPHRWLMGYRDGESDEKDWGSLIDTLALQPGAFKARFAVQPDTYLSDKEEEKPWNNNATVCRAWRKTMEGAGRQIVKKDIVVAAENATKFLMHDQDIQTLLQTSRKQVLLYGEYRDEPTGITVPVRGLVDLVPPTDGPFGGCLVDLKTCTSASQRAWAKSIFEYWYAAQSALYLDLWNKANGQSRQEFRHIIQESYAPWEVGKRILSADYLSIGRSQYLGALQRYAQCLKSDHWPGYDEPRSNADIVVNGWLVAQPEAWMILSQ